MRFQLNPERLGALHVEIAQTARRRLGALYRRQRGGARADRRCAARLVAEARAQGMRIADTQVDLSGQKDGRRTPGAAAMPFAQAQQHQQQPAASSAAAPSTGRRRQ